MLHQFLLNLPAKLQEEDKRLHILWSFWLTLAARLFWPTPWAFMAIFLLGLAKECWDIRFGTGFCFFDMAGNLLGITSALALASILPGGLWEK